MNLNKIKSDLEFLKKDYVVIYGSFASGEFRKGSDIDVAIITKIKETKTNIDILKNMIGMAPEVYDIRIFELLPLKVKVSAMNNFIVLFGDRLEISEYLYYYRKLWADCKYRIEAGYYENYQQQISAIQRFKRIKNEGTN